MQALWITLVFCFNEVYEGLSVAARLFDKIHITDDTRVRKSLHCILKSRYRRDLGEIAGELYLIKLLIDMFISDFCFCSCPRCKICCPL